MLPSSSPLSRASWLVSWACTSWTVPGEAASHPRRSFWLGKHDRGRGSPPHRPKKAAARVQVMMGGLKPRHTIWASSLGTPFGEHAMFNTTGAAILPRTFVLIWRQREEEVKKKRKEKKRQNALLPSPGHTEDRQRQPRGRDCLIGAAGQKGRAVAAYWTA